MPAARRLKVDNTTVSRRMPSWNAGSTPKLFQRCSDGFLLTEAGHKLFAIAEAIERKTLTVPEALGLRDAAQPAGRVRVASMEGIAAFYLSAKFAACAAVTFRVMQRRIMFGEAGTAHPGR